VDPRSARGGGGVTASIEDVSKTPTAGGTFRQRQFGHKKEPHKPYARQTFGSPRSKRAKSARTRESEDSGSTEEGIDYIKKSRSPQKVWRKERQERQRLISTRAKQSIKLRKEAVRSYCTFTRKNSNQQKTTNQRHGQVSGLCVSGFNVASPNQRGDKEVNRHAALRKRKHCTRGASVNSARRGSEAMRSLDEVVQKTSKRSG